MTTTVTYADDRAYTLPDGWQTVPADLLRIAIQQTRAALRGDSAIKRITAYYDPAGGYAGTTFLDAAPNDPQEVTAVDLWSVATLSMPVDARQGRRLFDDDTMRAQVHRQLHRISPEASLTDLDHAITGSDGSANALEAMWDLYDTFRTLVPTKGSPNRWVFAAKLCARKRPNLFPVRDNLVCAYLSGGRKLATKVGHLGWFHADIQTYAWLITHNDIRHDLELLREAVTARGTRVDEPLLKLLDVALWTCARSHGTGLFIA